MKYFGRIVDMGSEVRGFALGDRVFGRRPSSPAASAATAAPGRRHLLRNTVGVGVDRQGLLR